MRAEFQVLVIPYVKEDNDTKFIIIKRKDMGIWQFIAGGGESTEQPIEAASREFYEESGIKKNNFAKLDTITMIPVNYFKDHQNKQGLYDIPEYSFAVELSEINIKLSHEHLEYKTLDYETAIKHLHFDGNKTALWELRERIINSDLNT